MKGLVLALGKPKESPEEGPERSYAREAFSALKDDDEEGFIEAFLGAVRACAAKGEEDEGDDYDDEA